VESRLRSMRVIDFHNNVGSHARVNFGGGKTNQKARRKEPNNDHYRSRLPPGLSANCVCGYRNWRVPGTTTATPRGSRKIREGLRARRILPLLAKRNTEHGSGLGRWRWVVERTFAWLNQFRRLRVRYEKRADIHEAFLALACALLCWNALERHGTGALGRDQG
jgi:Transposase DDE domain